MKKILVIDDAEFILESTSTLLRFEGYDVFTASDGIEGIELALTIKPDLILCDISMPKLDGYGVLEKVRSTPEIETSPFIFLTAFTEKSNMRAGMEKGADDFLVKPYTRDELIAAIDAQWHKSKRVERQVIEKVEEVGRSVTSVLPHEFRTALNEIINTAKYMNNEAEQIQSPEIKEFTNDIIFSSNRLLKITESFLLYVQIDSFSTNPTKRKQLRSFSTIEPAVIISDISSLKAANHERLDNLVISHLCQNITLQISSESFFRILDELLDNAFKFSPKGSPVTIESRCFDDKIEVIITDEGRGMTNDQISNISALSQFERTFYEQQGVGLGLTIAKKLVELHDGEFKIKSTIGRGTKVIFTLYADKFEY